MAWTGPKAVVSPRAEKVSGLKLSDASKGLFRMDRARQPIARKRIAARIGVIWGCALTCHAAVDLAPAVPPAAGRGLDAICQGFAGYDQDADGKAEITAMRAVHRAGRGARRLLMLVEQRLLDTPADADPLRPALEQWCHDLAAEGSEAMVVAVQLAPSGLHQDGRYLLAIREFLRAVHRERPLEGVVLTGHFPDAFLVRSVNWRKSGELVLHNGTPRERKWKAVRYIRRVPEVVAQKADIVLADLDGAWEKIYVQPRTKLPSVTVVPGAGFGEDGGVAYDVAVSTRSREDFFHLNDGALAAEEQDGRWLVSLDPAAANTECGPADAARPNPMALPDLLVSRIDARNAAQRPRPDIVGTDGSRLLDARGRPQSVHFGEAAKVPAVASIWEHDPVLELRLLREYFERNHAYRTGSAGLAWRPASIACELGSGYRMMLKAADDWEPGDEKAANVSGTPTLLDFMEWMKYPAILRTVRAHSFPKASKFRKSDTNGLEAALVSPPWAWVARGDALVPSLKSASGGGMLDWHLLRSIYESKRQAQQPAFYHHTGCDIISPDGAGTLPYDDPHYGAMQAAESLMFFGQGLALVGRAKVFYDEPAGFTAALSEGKTIGAAWARYFDHDSAAADYSSVGGDIGRKKAYFWSVLGDFTLRLQRPAGPGK